MLWQVFRIARIMRVFKLARRSVGLQSIVYTVKTSYKDLGLLFSLVFMGMLVFGSLLYYAENGEPDTGFYSIPQVWLTWRKKGDETEIFGRKDLKADISRECGGGCRP